MNNYPKNKIFGFVWLLFFCLLPIGVFTQKQANIEGPEIPASLERKFKRDAARLALRAIALQDDLRYQTILIPSRSVDNFYQILTDIFRKQPIAQSIEKCNIHTFPNPSIDHLVVIFDKNAAWAAPLKKGINQTDSKEINNLLREYDLVIEKHIQWNDRSDAITVRSKEPLNMAALANEFYNIKGVVETDLGTPETVGNDIEFNRINGGWEVIYKLRFGAHISGNGKTHSWKFKAMDDGSIRFINEEGDEVPEWMRCSNAPVSSGNGRG